MKVLPFKIPKPESSTIIIQEDHGSMFYDKLHQHEEIQISLIEKGEGTFIIGDYVGSFKEGDIFVIGESLPHVFNNDKSAEEVHMVSLFFLKTCYGEHFFSLPEFKQLSTFFRDASLGFTPISPVGKASRLIKQLPYILNLQRFVTFLEILTILSKSENKTLSSAIHTKKYGEEEGKRMRNIFEFTLANFDKSISLDQVAQIANMTPNAFCRYFKQRTNKTYVNFLLDIRIGNACKLLSKKSDLSIAEISYKSGFNNLTNFNRKFKSLKGLTPSTYRKKA